MFSTRRALAGHAAVCAALVASLWGSSARADQVVVMDETWVHAPDLADSHFRIAPIEGTPTNWVSPVDYSQGKAYVYLEVHTKPTEQPTRFQVCFEATPTYACTAQSPIYTEVGVYEWESDFSGFWSPPNEEVDWTQGVKKIACILKDTMNGKPSADNVGPEMAALYMPTEVRMVVTLVSPGGVYVPPTPSGEESTGGDESSGTSGDSDSDGDSSSDSSSGGVGSTGGVGSSGDGPEASSSTGAPTTSGTSTSQGEVVTGEPGGGSSGGSSSTTQAAGASASSGGAENSASGDGCACGTSSEDSPASLALAGLLLALARRRRLSAASRA